MAEEIDGEDALGLPAAPRLANRTPEGPLRRRPLEDARPDVARRDADEPEPGRREQGGVLLARALPPTGRHQHLEVRQFARQALVGRANTLLTSSVGTAGSSAVAKRGDVIRTSAGARLRVAVPMTIRTAVASLT